MLLEKDGIYSRLLQCGVIGCPGRKMKLKRILFHDTAVYMGNHSNIFRSSYFIKLRKYPHMRYRGCVGYKMEYKQWTKPWAVYIHAW